MSKVITIKLTRAGRRTTLFNILDQDGNIIASNVTRSSLIDGLSYSVSNSVRMVTLSAIEDCTNTKTKLLENYTTSQIINTKFVETTVACLWRHLTEVNTSYNKFYGIIQPYILEYPFAYSNNDEILQNVKMYSKVYKFMQDSTGVFSYNDKIEIDDGFFNQAVVYNNQQSSGLLILEKKPKNNLNSYMSYPKYNSDSKTILYTKSDNFYQFNNFWNVVKDKTVPLFLTSCKNLSIDKKVNTINMLYGTQSFQKYSLRAKELKVRMILSNRSDINIVSQFILAGNQLSYK